MAAKRANCAKVTVIFYFSSDILLRLTPSGKKQMKQKTSTRRLLEGIWLATLETSTVTSIFSLKNSALSQKHLCAQLHVQVLSVCVAFIKTLKSSRSVGNFTKFVLNVKISLVFEISVVFFISSV